MQPPRSKPITSGIAHASFALTGLLETDMTVFTKASLLPSGHLFQNSATPRQTFKQWAGRLSTW
jgi:hypothetical protein